MTSANRQAEFAPSDTYSLDVALKSLVIEELMENKGLEYFEVQNRFLLEEFYSAYN